MQGTGSAAPSGSRHPDGPCLPARGVRAGEAAGARAAPRCKVRRAPGQRGGGDGRGDGDIHTRPHPGSPARRPDTHHVRLRWAPPGRGREHGRGNGVRSRRTRQGRRPTHSRTGAGKTTGGKRLPKEIHSSRRRARYKKAARGSVRYKTHVQKPSPWPRAGAQRPPARSRTRSAQGGPSRRRTRTAARGGAGRPLRRGPPPPGPAARRGR